MNLLFKNYNHTTGEPTIVEMNGLRYPQFKIYTGIKDKNGKMVFEGDIVRMDFTAFDYVDGVKQNPVDEIIIGIVEYSEESASFVVVNITETGTEELQIGTGVEVIGDAYTKKELFLDLLENRYE